MGRARAGTVGALPALLRDGGAVGQLVAGGGGLWRGRGGGVLLLLEKRLLHGRGHGPASDGGAGGDGVGGGGGDGEVAGSCAGTLQVLLHIVGLHVEGDEPVLDQVSDGLERLLSCGQRKEGSG